jgi:hypothetical protein
MPPHGSVDESWRDAANQNLDLMAVRFLIVPPEAVEPRTFKDEQGLTWSTVDLNIQIGSGCNPKNPTDFTIDLAAPAAAARIGIVSALACSIPLADKENFATLKLTDVNQKTITLPLAAGNDSSEWAYDCTDVRPVMKQGRAQVFRSYPVTRGDIKCQGHDYVSVLPIGGLNQIKTVELHATSESATFSLKKISLIDDTAQTTTRSVQQPGRLTMSHAGGESARLNPATAVMARKSAQQTSAPRSCLRICERGHAFGW